MNQSRGPNIIFYYIWSATSDLWHYVNLTCLPIISNSKSILMGNYSCALWQVQSWFDFYFIFLKCVLCSKMYKVNQTTTQILKAYSNIFLHPLYHHVCLRFHLWITSKSLRENRVGLTCKSSVYLSGSLSIRTLIWLL